MKTFLTLAVVPDPRRHGVRKSLPAGTLQNYINLDLAVGCTNNVLFEAFELAPPYCAPAAPATAQSSAA